MLKFSPANAKTKSLSFLLKKPGTKIYSLDLRSGLTCPGAKDCKSWAKEDEKGKFTIQDGPDCQFRCFSAVQENVWPSTRAVRTHNWHQLRKCKTAKRCRDLILESLPKNAGIVRYHVGGDFFSLAYLRGAVLVAESRPDVLFYGYTKSLHHLEKIGCQDLSKGIVRPNFLLTGSAGGKYDHLLWELGIRTAYVVFSEEEAGKKGLKIDHTDEHAATPGGSFALLLHGTQKAGTDASKALQALKGKGSYSR